MEVNKNLRLIAGIVCIAVAITRIFFVIFDLGGAMVYSYLFLDPGDLVNIFEAILIVIFGFIITVFATIVAVGVYIVLGILQITLRKHKTPTIICTVFSSISIVLSLRAVILLVTIGEIDIFIISLMIMYIVILSLCIVSYIRFTKQAVDK